ncbi:MAG: hypothetical protein J5988_15040 [Eubacterium sp.]|nr:hypothetical protein [Eubacterium sp.]
MSATTFPRLSGSPNVFSLKDFLLVTAVELILICLATWLLCWKLLFRQVVELMRGENQGSIRLNRL